MTSPTKDDQERTEFEKWAGVADLRRLKDGEYKETWAKYAFEGWKAAKAHQSEVIGEAMYQALGMSNANSRSLADWMKVLQERPGFRESMDAAFFEVLQENASKNVFLSDVILIREGDDV